MKKFIRRYLRLPLRIAKKSLKKRVKSFLLFLNPNAKFYSLGAQGERAVSRYLKKRYYLIWERNYQSHLGEIDIIASVGRTLVFVEVKTRSSSTAKNFSGLDAIDLEKRERITKAAEHFIGENTALLRRRRTLKVRYDAIIVERKRAWPLPMKISHYPDAFSNLGAN